jgi:hypothetical protein
LREPSVLSSAIARGAKHRADWGKLHGYRGKMYCFCYAAASYSSLLHPLR